MFESQAYGFAVSFVDDIAASVDEKSSDTALSEKVGDTVAKIALADRAEVKENGILDSDAYVIDECHGFQKIGRKSDYFLRREGIVGIVAEIGEGVSDERCDFPASCCVELKIHSKHRDEIFGNLNVSRLLFHGKT